MTIRHLEIFLAVAKHMSMNKAAKELYLSQPTVSNVIKELERYYGVLLFERLSKRLYITEDGKKLLSSARRVLENIEHMNQMMLQEQKTSLRIGASITVGTTIIPKLVKKIEAGNMNIIPTTHINNTETIEKMLLKNELDIAIVEGDIKSVELETFPLVKDFLVLFCANEHPLSKKKEITLHDLQDVQFVMREKGSGTRALFEEFMQKHKCKFSIKWDVPSFDFTKMLVEEDLCVGVASVRLVTKDLLNKKLHAIQYYNSDWERTFQLTYHKDKFLNKAMQAFISIAKTEVPKEKLYSPSELHMAKLIQG